MSNADKKVEIFRILPLIPLRLSKKILEKSKFFRGKNLVISSNNKNRHSYVQASSSNIKEILKIKEIFLNISLKKNKRNPQDHSMILVR